MPNLLYTRKITVLKLKETKDFSDYLWRVHYIDLIPIHEPRFDLGLALDRTAHSFATICVIICGLALTIDFIWSLNDS